MRSRSFAAVAAAAALTLVSLTACGTATEGGGTPTSVAGAVVTNGSALEGVSAEGPVDHKTAPKVSLATTPITSTGVERKTLVKGTGPASTSADRVTVRVQIYNGTSGKLVDDGFAEDRPAETYGLGRTDLIGGFVKGLTGVTKNERVAFTIPPSQGFGDSGNEGLGIGGKDTMVIIADVSDVTTPISKIEGEMTQAGADLPQVEFKDGATKAPTVTIPAGVTAPTATKSATLVEGKGAVVEKGQTLSVQYHGVLWKDGKKFDSSWDRGTPAEFPIGVGQVITGWDKTLVGAKVGSRMLLVIPPADGYGAQGSASGGISGTDTLVFVVDILDAY